MFPGMIPGMPGMPKVPSGEIISKLTEIVGAYVKVLADPDQVRRAYWEMQSANGGVVTGWQRIVEGMSPWFIVMSHTLRSLAKAKSSPSSTSPESSGPTDASSGST